jgi:cyclopropane fatty-acyl-phospholipid synthase-like methyltransferase
MDIKKQMDGIYGRLSPEEIPWNIERPPALLLELVESGRLQLCDAIDLGCGAGNYSVWLAEKGFEVTGIEVSEEALALARKLAGSRGVSCRFIARDLTADLEGFDLSFDFAFEWEVLHHIFPEHRARYVSNVHRMLRPGGLYLSVCFSEEDVVNFGGEGKYCRTPLGTTLYFSSESELRELCEPLFDIQELETVDVPGKFGPHRAVKALMTKR